MFYKICIRCIMDTTDPDIKFDTNGVCNHCYQMEEKSKKYVIPHDELETKLKKMVTKIKKHGKNKKYDCIIGVSGGVDSTYVAYLVKKLGLRPLAVHLDNGWNSEISVNNIHKALNILGIELETYVLDWDEFKDLQLAFLKASTPDSEIPTDHAIYALLRKAAAKNNVKYIVDGVNYSSETIMPKSWSQGYSDWGYIKLIQKKFGKVKLKSFPHYTFWNLFYYKRIKGQKTVSILNYIDYNKIEAKKILQEKLGWQDYGGKHYESLYTRFFQAYILPAKFGFDKRRAHLSTLINAGHITRDQALKEMEKPLYPEELLVEHKKYVAKKFGLSAMELDEILSLPPKRYKDYRPNTKYAIENMEEMIFRRFNPFSFIIRKTKRLLSIRS